MSSSQDGEMESVSSMDAPSSPNPRSTEDEAMEEDGPPTSPNPILQAGKRPRAPSSTSSGSSTDSGPGRKPKKKPKERTKPTYTYLVRSEDDVLLDGFWKPFVTEIHQLEDITFDGCFLVKGVGAIIRIRGEESRGKWPEKLNSIQLEGVGNFHSTEVSGLEVKIPSNILTRNSETDGVLFEGCDGSRKLADALREELIMTNKVQGFVANKPILRKDKLHLMVGLSVIEEVKKIRAENGGGMKIGLQVAECQIQKDIQHLQ